MMIESIIALVCIAILGISVILMWADSFYQASRRAQRVETRKTFDQ